MGLLVYDSMSAQAYKRASVVMIHDVRPFIPACAEGTWVYTCLKQSLPYVPDVHYVTYVWYWRAL